MAMIGNPYAKYQDSKILTATPAELTLMLYEGIIKFTNIAIAAVENREFQKANTNIMKAERIVDHLSATLNDKYPVAKDFRNVYNCIMQALIQGNMKKRCGRAGACIGIQPNDSGYMERRYEDS